MSTSPDLLERSIRTRAYLSRVEADPLSVWKFPVARLRTAFRLFTDPQPLDELHCRGANGTGKTEAVAAFVAACLQKRDTLDGIFLPHWRGPVEAAQLVLDYKQQLLSVQPAYLRVLGKWPYHARYNGETLASLRIKPINGSDDETTWSVLHFLSQENKRSGVGVRADIVAFDEPPVIEILRELRKAAHAHRRSIIIIGETPTIRRQWLPLKDDYGETPRRSIRRVDRERAEVRWSLEDVADWLIDAEAKAKMRRKYSTDPLAAAREHGDYTVTEGACPFDVTTLLAMREECVEPRILKWKIGHEGDDGAPALMRTVDVEVFETAKANTSYWMTIDASSGVDDAKHDPYEIEVGEVGSGGLACRVGGRMPGKLVGILGAGLCRQYNNATADPEINDRWGVNVLDGFSAARYSNFARERRQLKPGEWVNEIGFHNNAQSRPEIIGSVQAWIEAWRAGHKYAKCPSKFIIDTLLDCILDEDGKIVAAPGLHDEALICWGQLLRRAVRLSNRVIPQLEQRAPTPDEVLIRRLQARAFSSDEDLEPVLRGRARP